MRVVVDGDLAPMSVFSGITDSCSSLAKSKRWLPHLNLLLQVGVVLALPAGVESIVLYGFNSSEVWLALVVKGSSSGPHELY